MREAVRNFRGHHVETYEFYNAEFSLEPSLHFFTTTAKRLAKRETLTLFRV